MRTYLRTQKMALGTGFEPVIYAVKERCPGPLDEPSKINLHV